MIRDQIGVDRIMWGADYPHLEGTWPRSLPALRDTLNGCTEAEIRMMVGETTARVYGFDLDALRPLAERIGPSLADIQTDATDPVATYEPVDYATGRVTGKESARRIISMITGGVAAGE